VAAIELDEVVKVYPDGTRAVKGVDLDIRDGDLMVLVGPSGCGKTTVLRMVAGLEHLTGGEIRIGDRVVNDVAPKDRDLAMVFQNYALYPHMSVYENMAFGLRLRKADKGEIDRRVRRAAETLGLADMLERKPRQLSGGQRQRVAMGRAIVREPVAFLMDEPLSNLDAALRVQMRTEVARLQKDLGVTTIYVTHDQTEAMTMGDQVAVMRDGILQQVDDPQTLYSRPRNVFVGGFIGSPAMNLVAGRIEAADGGLAVAFGSHRLRIDDEACAAHEGLRGFEGRDVILGVRPEDIEDAELAADAPADRRMRGTVELRESMGADVYAHFRVDAPPAVTAETRALAASAGAEVLSDLERRAERQESTFVARLNPRTAAAEGDTIELAVDTRALHFFDPETGDGIYG
jgi:multiple sugar transport system ATP-binding protein